MALCVQTCVPVGHPVSDCPQNIYILRETLFCPSIVFFFCFPKLCISTDTSLLLFDVKEAPVFYDKTLHLVCHRHTSARSFVCLLRIPSRMFFFLCFFNVGRTQGGDAKKKQRASCQAWTANIALPSILTIGSALISIFPLLWNCLPSIRSDKPHLRTFRHFFLFPLDESSGGVHCK